MTLTLQLSPELEERLTAEAERQGSAPETYTLRLLEESLPPRDRAKELEALREAWKAEGDLEEQRETFEYLVRVLDEDRLSDRPLFPPELKGVTW
jgi:predicted DNA-binding protein